MAKPEDIEYLANTTLFKRLDREHLEFLCDHMKVISVGAQESLRKYGEPADSFYIVMEGLVDLYTHEQPKRRVQTVGVDNVIGWSWAVAPYAWTYDVVTQTPAMLVEFDGKAIRARCAQEPAFGFAVMKRVCELMFDRLNHVRTLLRIPS